MIAIGLGRELGIDVELLRPEFAGEDIAKRYFSEKEAKELGGLSAELRTEGFFGAGLARKLTSRPEAMACMCRSIASAFPLARSFSGTFKH